MVYVLFAVFAALLIIALFAVRKCMLGDTRKPGPENVDHGQSRKRTEHVGKSHFYAQVDAYLESGQTQRALYQANRNIAYNPDDPAAYINRARAYEALGAVENAILDLTEALRTAPDNREARSRLERLSKVPKGVHSEEKPVGNPESKDSRSP